MFYSYIPMCVHIYIIIIVKGIFLSFSVPASSRKLSGSILTVVPIAMVIMILASGMTRLELVY